MKPTREDFLLTVRKASFRLPEASPVRVRREVNGETVWEPHVTADKKVYTRSADSNLLLTDLSFRDAAGLTESTELSEYRDFPVVTLESRVFNPTDIDLPLSRLISFKHEFCGDFVSLRTCGMEVKTLPCYTAGSALTVEFDDHTVFLDSPGATAAVYPTPLGVEVFFLTADKNVSAGGEIVMPKVTVMITDGGKERSEAIYSAYAGKHLS